MKKKKKEDALIEKQSLDFSISFHLDEDEGYLDKYVNTHQISMMFHLPLW